MVGKELESDEGSCEYLDHGTRDEKVIEMDKDGLAKFVNDHLQCGDTGMQYNSQQIMQILSKVTQILKSEPMLLPLKAPLKICGDIHGQFSDLKRLFRASGRPPSVSFLFLGDYVDRGPNSLETIVLLLCMKARYPGSVFLLRGNHEVENINKVYGFHDELKRRKLICLFPEFNRLFQWMPLAAIINSKILCMHGGISRYMESLDDIKRIERPLTLDRPSDNRVAMDLLWADPDPNRLHFHRSPRGVSFVFGTQALEKFCIDNRLDLIVRAHQCVQAGFERLNVNATTRLVTLFSAPQYCGEMDNNAAVMVVRENMSIKFDVLEVEKDTAYINKRNRERALVPRYDQYPQVTEFTFEPFTKSIVNMFDIFKLFQPSKNRSKSDAMQTFEGKELVIADDEQLPKKYGSVTKQTMSSVDQATTNEHKKSKAGVSKPHKVPAPQPKELQSFEFPDESVCTTTQKTKTKKKKKKKDS